MATIWQLHLFYWKSSSYHYNEHAFNIITRTHYQQKKAQKIIHGIV